MILELSVHIINNDTGSFLAIRLLSCLAFLDSEWILVRHNAFSTRGLVACLRIVNHFLDVLQLELVQV